MKKRLFLSTIFALTMGAFTSCNDTPDAPVAPVIDDVVGTYTSDKLATTVDGKEIKTGSIELVKDANSKITVNLTDLIEGVKTFSIKGCAYESLTKSFYSKITGEGTQAGIKVKYEGSVDENGVLTSNIVILPPTIEDVIATYTGDNLKSTLNGEANTGTVIFIKEGADKITVRLKNVIENVDSVDVKGCTYKSLTKGFYSQIAGEVNDAILGYTIKFTGDVENNILTSTITVSDFGEVANVKTYRNLIYKGEMSIDVTDMPNAKQEQRIYTLTPRGSAEDKLKLQIENFNFSGIQVGTITLDTVSFTQRGDVLGFRIAERELKIAALEGLGKVTVEGNGNIIGDKLSTILNITVGDAGAMKVKVDFGGDKVTEDNNPSFDVDVKCSEAIIPFGLKEEYSSDYLLTVFESADPAKLVLTPTLTLKSTKSTVDSIYVYTAKTGEKTSYKLGDKIDFSKFEADDYLFYFVRAEDIRKYRERKVFVKKVASTVLSFDMSGDWNKTDNGFMLFEEPANLASSNTAAGFLTLYGLVFDEYPVSKEGKYAKLQTLSTVISDPNDLVPAVTAATMFNGVFEIDMENTLKSTKFGEIYTFDKAPSTFKFTYKYQAGPKFFKSVPRHLNGDETDTALVPEEVPGKEDKGVISAYLYEVSDYTMSNENILTGVNINDSNKVILKASLVCDNTSQFETKELEFEALNGKTFSPDKKYRLAIVCTPSMEGDLFAGAPESTLWIEKLEVVIK